MSCSICLQTLSSPVSPPCGHVFCQECLSSHVAHESSALEAKCPTCRTTFKTVSPDLTCVPKKYHDFIAPSVRRVYVSDEANARLRSEVTRLQTTVDVLDRDKELLMQRCESSMAAATRAGRGENEARQKIAELEKEVLSLKAQVKATKALETSQVAPAPARRGCTKAALLPLRRFGRGPDHSLLLGNWRNEKTAYPKRKRSEVEAGDSEDENPSEEARPFVNAPRLPQPAIRVKRPRQSIA